MLKKVIQKGVKVILIMTMVLSMIIAYSNTIISNAAESELTLTPKPETNNIHLKWTGPQNSSYKVYQKSQEQAHLKQLDLQILVILMKRLKYLMYIQYLQQYIIHQMYK